MAPLLHLAGVSALVDDPSPPEVTDDGRRKPALDSDRVDPFVELTDPLPPADPTVLWSAGCYHALGRDVIVTVLRKINARGLTSKLELVQS